MNRKSASAYIHMYIGENYACLLEKSVVYVVNKLV